MAVDGVPAQATHGKRAEKDVFAAKGHGAMLSADRQHDTGGNGAGTTVRAELNSRNARRGSHLLVPAGGQWNAVCAAANSRRRTERAWPRQLFTGQPSMAGGSD